MTEHIPAPLPVKRVVTKTEELRRKREGAWDPTTMVGETSPEGAALRASRRASPEKVADAQPIAIEPLKNETLPSLSTRDEIISDGRRLISERRVGAMLGFSKRTLQRWRQENKGPPWVKIGRRIYYDEDKLNAWIRDH